MLRHHICRVEVNMYCRSLKWDVLDHIVGSGRHQGRHHIRRKGHSALVCLVRRNYDIVGNKRFVFDLQSLRERQ